MTDWGRLYRDNVEALTALAGDLREDELATHVPATPAWTVRDVYAHLAGGPADALSGRMDGAPGPEWTSRHVGERARLPLDVLVAEIRSQQDAVAEAVADQPAPALVWDVTVHHTDVHECLGLGRPPESLWRPVLDAAAPRMVRHAGDDRPVRGSGARGPGRRAGDRGVGVRALPGDLLAALAAADAGVGIPRGRHAGRVVHLRSS